MGKYIIIAAAILTVVIGGIVYLGSGRGPNSLGEQTDGYSTSTTGQVSSSSLGANILETTTIKSPKSMNTVALDTNFGKIVFQTYDEDAPKTVENFITLANKGFYNGVVFHRVIKGFMIQGGDPTGTGAGGPGYQFADELNAATESYKAGYKKGVVAMANAGPNTNGSQFFIMHQDYPLPNAYTIFGKVIEGQDVVDAIASVQTDGNDKPLSPVTIKSATIQKAGN